MPGHGKKPFNQFSIMKQKNKDSVKIIKDKNSDKIIAIIVRHHHQSDGIDFFTPDHFPQQLGYMSHRKGHSIKRHMHNPIKREFWDLQEVLLIKRGKLRADLFSDKAEHVSSPILEAGDLIFIASGGHGFEVIEDVEMIEVKQGPFIGEDAKTYF